MYRIEKRSKYDDLALDDDEVIVFDTFEDYANSIKNPKIYTEFFERHPEYDSAPCIFKFVRNEEQAKEFVEKAIEAGDNELIGLQELADDEELASGAYGICMGELDNIPRFSFTEQGYLLDDPE